MKNSKAYREIGVAIAVSFAANLLSGLALAAAKPVQTMPTTRAATSVTCHAYSGGAVENVAQSSQDADHIYFSGSDSNFAYDAVFHIQENFVYLQVSTRSDNPVTTSGNFLLNGVGLSATLTYTQGKTVAQLVCSE